MILPNASVECDRLPAFLLMTAGFTATTIALANGITDK